MTKSSAKLSPQPGLAPFFSDVLEGESMRWNGDRDAYMHQLDALMHALGAEGQFAPWE